MPDTLEKERKKFEDYVELFGEHRFNREVVVQDREYTVSTDPAELQAVDRSARQALARNVAGFGEVF